MEGQKTQGSQDNERVPKGRASLRSFQTVDDFWNAHARAQTHEEIAGVLHGGWSLMFSGFHPGSGFKKGDPDVVRLFLEYAERGYGEDGKFLSEDQADFIVFFKLLPHLDLLKVVYTRETEEALMLLLKFFQRIAVPQDDSMVFGFTPFHRNDRRLRERAARVGSFLNRLEGAHPFYGPKKLQEMWEAFHREIDQTIICLGILVPEMWKELACFDAQECEVVRIFEEIALGTFSYPFGKKQIPVFPNTLIRYNSFEEAIRRDPYGLQGRAALKVFSLRNRFEEQKRDAESIRAMKRK